MKSTIVRISCLNYYKYNPVNGDTAQISILLYDYPDSVTFMDPEWYTNDDTIGLGIQTIIIRYHWSTLNIFLTKSLGI